jgi:hypothetical protein
MEITNTGVQVVQIDYTPSLDLDLTLPQETVKHWWVEKGSGNPSNHGTHKTTIDGTFSYIGVSTPYDNTNETNNEIFNEPVPWQSIHATSGEHGLYTGIESSACIMQEVDAEGDANTVKLTLGVDESISTFRAELQPAEVFEFPPVFIGCFTGEVDDGSNRLRRWVESRLLPDCGDSNLPLLKNNTWGYGLAGATESIAMMKLGECISLGLEEFHLGAGWYQDVGYWYEKPANFPSGLRYVSDYAYSNGILFGLWCGWSMGNDLTGMWDAALSINNPAMTNWFSSPGPEWPSGWPFGSYSGPVVCLAHELAKNWIINDITRCIEDNNLYHVM